MTETKSGGITRRTLAKGAAWTVPAVATVAATPAMAATGDGPLEFTGVACKLPGNSSDTFKGYVLELEANNVLGPNPLNTVTVITAVSVGGVPEDNYFVKVVGGNPGDCTCFGNCAGGLPQFCTPDGTLNQRILVYTEDEPTGDSANTLFELWYQRYECAADVCVPFDADPVRISTAPNSTPPTQDNPGGGPCPIPRGDVFPLPT